jgi:hypothetical protein
MAESKSATNDIEISRDRLAELLNEDLSREYQAIIAYVVYSQVLKGAEYMDIAAQLEIHAAPARMNAYWLGIYARARRGPRGELAEQGAERPAGAAGAAGSPLLFFAMAMAGAMAGAIGGARWRRR